MMSELPLAIGGADAGLAERLDEEISAFHLTGRCNAGPAGGTEGG
jgi:hypothetical protein